MSQKVNAAIAVINIDIGQNSFHIVGQNQRGAIVLRQKWSRDHLDTPSAEVYERMRQRWRIGLPGACEPWWPKSPVRGLSDNQLACTLISIMARSTRRSNQRPDALMPRQHRLG
jgi:hypothetical protein